MPMSHHEQQFYDGLIVRFREKAIKHGNSALETGKASEMIDKYNYLHVLVRDFQNHGLLVFSSRSN
jgi:hypothetical protein